MGFCIGAAWEGTSAAGVDGGVSSGRDIGGRSSGFAAPSTCCSESLSGGEGEGESGRADVGVLVFGEVKPLAFEMSRESRLGGDDMFTNN